MNLSAWIKAVRPSHWVKNGLIFMPLVFAQRWDSINDWKRVLCACLAFCAMASAGYLVNDVQDRDKDRLHPTKKNRPIASGKITASQAYGVALFLCLTSLGVGWWLSPMVAAVLGAYAILMYAYSRGLKRVPLIDLLVIALGFVIRISVGGLAIQVPLSGWLILCTFIVALLLGLGKRIVELQRVQGASTRKTLGFYTRERTLWMERVLSVFAVATYAAYTVSGKHSPWMALSVLPVLCGVIRYSMLLTHTHAEGPTEMLIKDRVLQLALLTWIAIVVVVLTMSSLS